MQGVVTDPVADGTLTDELVDMDDEDDEDIGSPFLKFNSCYSRGCCCFDELPRGRRSTIVVVHQHP